MGSAFKTRYAFGVISKLPKLVKRLESRRQQRLPYLGEREMMVLEALWAGGGATAQTVKSLMPDDGISLSTVQSTLERLHRKRLVERAKTGRAYCYSTKITKSQLIAGLLRDMTHSVAAGDMAPMISGFLSYLSDEAPELLDDLPNALDGKPDEYRATESADD